MIKDKISSGAINEGLYSTVELKDACKEAETRYLKQVFRESYVPNLRTTNLIDHLEHMAIERRLYNDDRYKQLIKNLKELSKTTGALINGERGERLAGKALSHLFIRNATLHGVCLEYGDEPAEIDYVVITHKGIFPIEVKYYTCDIDIDECGLISGAGCSWAKPYSVGEKLRAKEFVLSRALEPELSQLADPTNIHSMILFANDSRSFTDHFRRYPTCCCGDVAQKIEGFDGADVFTDDQIEQVKSAILGKTYVPRYPSRIDFGEIEADLAYIMGLIEADVADEQDDCATHVIPDYEAIADAIDDDVDDDIVHVDTDPWDGWGWLLAAGSVPVILFGGYELYRHPSALRKLVSLVQF